MTMLIQNQFSGLAPKIDPRTLSDDLATEAHNCVFDRGNLRPLRAAVSTGVNLLAGTSVVYPYQGGWLQFTDESVSVCEAPLANDVHQRLYYTDQNYPKQKSGASEFRLGLPRPYAPTAQQPALPTEGEEDPDTLREYEDVYYVLTYVDAFGNEGPPSAPSNGVTRLRNQTVDVTFGSRHAGDYNFGPGALIRVYRSNTGTESTSFQYAGQVGYTAPGFVDNVPNDELQEVLPSTTWTAPPDDNAALWPDGPLQGLTLGPNGSMAGFARRTVYMSEPYLPHAWPVEYAITVDDDIMGIVWINSGLAVLTKGESVIITGSSPASMTVARPKNTLACISARSIVDMGGYALYASSEGLVAVDGSQFSVVTSELFDREQWRLYNPNSFVAGRSEGRYIAFYDNNTVQQCLVYDPKAGRGAVTTCDEFSDIVYYEPGSDALRVRDAANTLALFDQGGYKTFTWKSRIYTLNQPANFAYLDTVSSIYPLRIRLRAGDNIWTMTDVFDADVQYGEQALPAGFEYVHWQLEIEGASDVVELALYEDLSEVA